MTQPFRDRLRRGDLLLGTMVTLGTSVVAELLAGLGFDWLFLDAEHAPFTAADLQLLLQAAGPGVAGVIRLPSDDEVTIKQALDVGAAGVIVPQVNSAAQAAAVVARAKYPPAGKRGAGIARAHFYGLAFQEYVERANDEAAVIVQAEHADAVAEIEAIVRVPGVDAVLVGPYDLSASYGLIGQVNHPTVTAAIDRVTGACLEVGLPLGIFGVSASAVKPYIARGYTLIVAGVDTVLLGGAARAMLGELRPAD